MRQQILRLLQEVDKEICEGGEVRFRSISGFMHSNWISMLPGLTQSQFCWKDFVKLRQKKILFLTPSSIQVGCKMAGSTLGSSRFIWQMLALASDTSYALNVENLLSNVYSTLQQWTFIWKVVQCVSIRGVRSSHMYYKAGERESPESWTGNWRIESLKVEILCRVFFICVDNSVKSLENISILQDPNQVLILSTRNSQVKKLNLRRSH